MEQRLHGPWQMFCENESLFVISHLAVKDIGIKHKTTWNQKVNDRSMISTKRNNDTKLLA